MTSKEATRRAKVSMVKQIAKFNGCRVCKKVPMDNRRLHFHHLGPKTENPAAIRGLGALLTELSQCIVLCDKCHKLAETGKLFIGDHMRIDIDELSAIAGYVNFDWEPPTVKDLNEIPF